MNRIVSIPTAGQSDHFPPDDQINVFFLDDKGVFLPDAFRPDNLHPAAKGYDIRGEAVQEKLAELMKRP